MVLLSNFLFEKGNNKKDKFVCKRVIDLFTQLFFLLFIASIPIGSFFIIDGFGTISKILVIPLILSIVVTSSIKSYKINITHIISIFGLIIYALLISLFNYEFLDIISIINFSTISIATYLIAYYTIENNLLPRLFYAYFISSFGFSIYVIYLFSQIDGNGRVYVDHYSSNMIALSLGFTFLFGFVAKEFYNFSSKLITFLSLVILYAIFLTGSRSGLIAGLFFLLLYFNSSIKSRFNIFIFFSIFSFLIYDKSYLLSRIFLSDTSSYYELSGRSEIWSNFFETNLKYLFGNGLQSFEKIYSVDSHNTFIQILNDLGSIIFVFIVALLLFVLKNSVGISINYVLISSSFFIYFMFYELLLESLIWLTVYLFLLLRKNSFVSHYD